jgi:hypothetical protein
MLFYQKRNEYVQIFILRRSSSYSVISLSCALALVLMVLFSPYPGQRILSGCVICRAFCWAGPATIGTSTG